jgi:Flp pilus assembly protein TadG
MADLRQRSLSEESGVALVEFALVLPLLLVLLFGLIDFGKAFNYWIDETHLANEGARLAAVNFQPPGGQTLAAYIKSQADTNELKNGGTASVATPGANVSITYPNTTCAVGDPVRVSVSIQYSLLPFLGNRIGVNAPISLQSTATMRLEAVPAGGC